MRELSENNKVITEAAIKATEETRTDFVYKSIKNDKLQRTKIEKKINQSLAQKATGFVDEI